MYKDDEAARGERASTLIDEIADLERKKVEAANTEARLEEARRELSSLQAHAPTPAPKPEEKRPGVIAHVLVFAGTAGAAFLGYTLLF
jgi:ferric-dicitrate binding protein FerR (iron transport regulator)